MSERIDDIFAVLVLFQIKMGDSATFRSLPGALAGSNGKLDLLIYNNSPETWIGYEEDNERINRIIVNDVTNPGVSRAYNIAYKMARDKGKKWLMLLDQDSLLGEGLFCSFLKASEANNFGLCAPIMKAGIKIISPALYVPYRGFSQSKAKAGLRKLQNVLIINSGTFIDLDLFEKAGGFNERIKLDFSDIDFFRRVRLYCKQIYILDVICVHGFSGNDYSSFEASEGRFRIFMSNAREFRHEKGVSALLLLATIFVRTMHLSLKYRTFSFVRNLKFYFS